MSSITTIIERIGRFIRALSTVTIETDTEAVVFLAFCHWCLFYFLVQSVEGDMLSLTKVTRSEMGAYLCIAANGVPPSVSKRMMVHVHCKCQLRSICKEFLMAVILFLLQHLYVRVLISL
jgi:hypothetical protein